MSPTLWEQINNYDRRRRREAEVAQEDERERRRLEILRLEKEAADRKRRHGTRAGLTADKIVDALRAWDREWPPEQETFAQEALGVSGRYVRRVLADEELTWDEAKARVER
jgi:hypothetical protein